MTTSSPSRRPKPRGASSPPAGRRRESAADVDDVLRRYVPQGGDCAFANLRMLGRIVGSVYDEALRPVDLRASQLALLWAILACEPVELTRLERVTRTDQTTLSRTVNKLRAAGWVSITHGEDRRTRVARLTPAGRRRFAAAMPHWEAAQREVAAWLSIAELRGLAASARRRARDYA
jgi:DNA-binding MarR family transcriptional regulator